MQWLSAILILTFVGVNAQEPLPARPELILAPVSEGDKTYNGSFWVTCANRVRPGQSLTFGVQILKGDDPVTVTISLQNGHGNVTLASVEAEVSPAEGSKLVQMPISADIQPPFLYQRYGQYVVKVTGDGNGWSFKAQGHLNFEARSFTTFVQTDKAIYKPGQTVKVRALAIHPDLKTIRDAPWTIQVKDPDDDLVWQKLNIHNADTGVAEVEIPLADRTVTGDWTIVATIHGISETKTFTVDYYVLPKFEVEVSTKKPFGLALDEAMDVTVQATYTFGQPVVGGIYVLTISPTYYYCMHQSLYCQDHLEKIGDPTKKFIVLSGNLDDNGMAKLSVSTEDLLVMYNSLQNYQVTSLDWNSIRLHAVVTEPDTLRTADSELVYRFYKVPVTVSVLGITPSVYKPGLRWTGYFEVQKADGSKLSKEDASKLSMDFCIRHQVITPREPTSGKDKEEDDNDSKSKDEEEAIEIGSSSPRLAASSIAIGVPPDDYYDSVTITYEEIILKDNPFEVSEDGWVIVSLNASIFEGLRYPVIKGVVKPYEKFVSVYHQVYAAWSGDASFVQIQVPPERVKVGDTLDVTVTATEPMSHFTYQVYAKGSMIDTQTVQLATPEQEAMFQLELTQIMSPVVRLVVFYVRDQDKEVVVDAVTLNVDNLFARPVSLEFDPPTVKPGDDVTLKVKQEVGDEPAIAFLLANDKSVLLLKSGNDISQDLVRQAMLGYDYGYYYPWMRFVFMCGWPSFFSGRDANSVFQDAGIVVLTDANVYSYYEDEEYKRNPSFELGGPEMALPDSPEDSSANEGSTDRSEDPSDNIRKLFPENWLWNSEIIPAGSSEVSIPLNAPDTITSWVASAFTVHPSFGFTVAAETAELITTQRLSVQLDLPYSFTRNEMFCFTASVFNQEEQVSQMTLTLEKSQDFQLLYVMETANGQNVSVQSTHGRYTYMWGQVEANARRSFMFCIKPSVVGEVPVTVRVSSQQPPLSDAVQRFIKVKAEGVPRSQSFSSLVTAGGSSVGEDVAFLTNFVPGSQFITVNVVGNILGSLLDGIDKLLRKPYGCGEQNMLNFAPNVFVLDLLIRSGMMTEERLTKGQYFMSVGYQKAKLYEHNDTGGYSTFGRSSSTTENPSLWLTDFILKCFSQSEQLALENGDKVFPINLDVLERSVAFIESQQDFDEGYFVERGKVFNKAMMGGAATSSVKGLALTAYTVITLAETRLVFSDAAAHSTEQTGHYQSVVVKINAMLKKADGFLRSRFNDSDDPFEICITAYAMNLIDSPLKDEAFTKMQGAGVTKGDTLSWPRKSDVAVVRYPWSRVGDAIDVESTSYALLTYRLRDEPGYLPIVNYLVEQRGPNGGFHYTQDTVIGLQALTSLPDDFFKYENFPYTVRVTYMKGEVESQAEEFFIENKDSLSVIYSAHFNFEPENSENDRVEVNIKTESNELGGQMFTEIIMDYNVLLQTNDSFFETAYEVAVSEDSLQLTIQIRAREQAASMTLLTVDIPTGYEVDMDALLATRTVSFAEIRGDSLVIYFDTDVIGKAYTSVNIRLAMPTYFALPESPALFYTVGLYYSPDTEVTTQYFLDLAFGDFCSIVKNYNQCPFVYTV